MTENLAITTERVDDLPVLLAHQERMGLPLLLDKHFPMHGNWQGLSLGWVAVGWLGHILSTSNHRLNHVQGWAEKRLDLLRQGLHQPVRALDWSDDRLARLLERLSEGMPWTAFEQDLNRHLLRVYDLRPRRVRVDSTTASGYWSITEEGLFQLGRNTNHSGLPQVKVMLSTLDPLGLPVATQVLSGQRADDPLYVPAIAQVREGLGQRGLLYVGDCKMAALGTRAFVQAGGDGYLCPLPQTQLPPAVLESYLQPVWAEQQALMRVQRDDEVVALGYERLEEQRAVVDGEALVWTERRLVVRSLGQVQREEASLQRHLQAARAELEALTVARRGKKPIREVTVLRTKAEAVLRRHQVEGLLDLQYHEAPLEGRSKLPRVELRVTVDGEAVQARVQRLGWHVYATNQTGEQLSLAQGVEAYRGEYLIEQVFGRLKGKPLSLSPMYLQDERRATGLIRLLTLALRVLTLLEWQVRERLAAEKTQLAGLYAGNPKRSTARPTAEVLLEAFQEINLTIVQGKDQPSRHLTPLSLLQQRILTLLGLPLDLYTNLAVGCVEPP